MTRIYQNGLPIACTVVEAKPCVITQIKSQQKDGYYAVQLAYGDAKAKRTNKPQTGHFKAAKTLPKAKLVEFSNFEAGWKGEALQLGSELVATQVFEEGELIDVTGFSKGKGFCGVMKRHNFSGVGQQTHGQHNRQRAPGAIGACSTPSRVFKGMRMAGRTGHARTTIKNLEVLRLLPKDNLLLLKGSLPGPSKGYLILQK